MKPAHYTRERDAIQYAGDLSAAFPKSIGVTFKACPHGTGYSVEAMDSKGNRYLMTARQTRVADANFLEPKEVA